MVSAELLRQLYDYNFWARDQQLAVWRSLSEEQLSQPLGASFGSLRDTLKHLAGAEWVWMERFAGREARSVPWYKETHSLEALRSRWGMIEADHRRFLGTLTAESLAQPLTYVNFKGETWTYPLWQPLMHLANHGTYHRGRSPWPCANSASSRLPSTSCSISIKSDFGFEGRKGLDEFSGPNLSTILAPHLNPLPQHAIRCAAGPFEVQTGGATLRPSS
jgi:uncharacterized damage-inducible protein DinB